MPVALVVDDNESIRRLIVRVLEKDDIAGVEACSGVEALQIIDRSDRPFDVILLDLMMIPGSGFDVIRELSERHPELLGKVIVMTAATGHLTNEALSRVRTTLKKPFALHELRRAIHSCIGLEIPRREAGKSLHRPGDGR